VVDCLGMIPGLVKAAAAGDRERLESAAADLSGIEQEADALKKELRSRLSTSIFASVSRSEIMVLVKTQDDVADRCERLGDELAVRETTFPEFLREDAVSMAETAARSASPLAEMLRLLDSSGASLSRKESAKLAELLDGIRDIVADVEITRDRFLRSLFSRENEVGALDAVFLMRFAQHVGEIAGEIENVVDIISRFVAGE